MDDDITNLIRREVQRALMGVHATVGVVSSYDKQTHAVKLTHQPDGTQSGLAPIVCKAAGQYLSVVHAPSPGDQAIVMYLNGDRESPVVVGFIHSDQDQPPQAESGETVIQHTQNPGQGNQTRTTLKIDKTGAVTTTTQNDNATVSTTTTGANSSVTTTTQGTTANISNTASGANSNVSSTAAAGVTINSGTGVVDMNT